MRALCVEYGPSTLALLRTAITDRMAVEDVYQQVLLEAWQRSASYDPARASLNTWLSTIARSRAIDHLRRRVPEPYDPTLDYAATPAAREGSVEVIDRLILDDVLERLPREEREVVRMRYHFGLSQRQIALILAIPIGTVKSRTAAALRRLRTMLEEERTPL